MKVAALQMVSAPDLAENLATAAGLLAQAADAGAELAVLPEYFGLLGHQDTDKLALAEPAPGPDGLPTGGPMQRLLSDAARQGQMWVVGGTVPIATPDPQQVFNTTLVFAPTGRCVARYDKVHLFNFQTDTERYDEAAVLRAGHGPVAFELPSRDGHRWRVGLSICYDLRFPELYRALSAELLLVPSAFTWTTGQKHWEVLLRARAIENQAYVLAAAQGGRHGNGRRTWGQSLLADPWGELLAQRPEGTGLVLGECHAERLATVRRQLPALTHRRVP